MLCANSPLGIYPTAIWIERSYGTELLLDAGVFSPIVSFPGCPIGEKQPDYHMPLLVKIYHIIVATHATFVSVFGLSNAKD
jgi:hypothetical protein